MTDKAVRAVIGPPVQCYRSPGMPLQTAGRITARQVAVVLRRHILLILLVTAVGCLIGGTTCWMLRRYVPQYRAQAQIEVLAPGREDPFGLASPQVPKDLLYEARVSMAGLLCSQAT
ncbi:MAG: hypothetical protein QHH07_12760, partial [Sedimentisphaerales bacterium]|nr:hypothetical protein [Sedimentisphaerales bacterium]